MINEYENMINSNYSFNDIQLYILIKYNIDINEYEFNKIRFGQEEFRENLIKRYKTCILTDSPVFEACHIIPHADSNNMCIDNGLLLNYQHHKMFDLYIFSINPDTLMIEINYNKIDMNDIFIQQIINKKINILENYPNTIKYLKHHYEQFILFL
jgi:hypothetical protein